MSNPDRLSGLDTSFLPVQRLDEVRLAMAGIKESGQAVAAQALTDLAGFAPPTILAQVADANPARRTPRSVSVRVVEAE